MVDSLHVRPGYEWYWRICLHSFCLGCAVNQVGCLFWGVLMSTRGKSDIFREFHSNNTLSLHQSQGLPDEV